MLIFGTRPEAIKMCPLVTQLQKDIHSFQTIVCVTGQHREMLDQVLRLFDVKPDYDLDIMQQGQDLYDITTRILTGMRDILNKCKPDIVLVHGDTTTSAAAALAAFYQQIPVGHVEAGLRTNNIYSPWPEEMNRQLTGRIATYHFSPTQLSRSNLLSEGIKDEKIIVINGDGDFQMNMQELAVLGENKLDIIVFILNNSQLGIIRQWEEDFYDMDPYQVMLKNPDFVKLAASYGIDGVRVDNIADLVMLLDKDLKGPLVVEIVVESENIPLPK